MSRMSFERRCLTVKKLIGESMDFVVLDKYGADHIHAVRNNVLATMSRKIGNGDEIIFRYDGGHSEVTDLKLIGRHLTKEELQKLVTREMMSIVRDHHPTQSGMRRRYKEVRNAYDHNRRAQKKVAQALGIENPATMKGYGIPLLDTSLTIMDLRMAASSLASRNDSNSGRPRRANRKQLEQAEKKADKLLTAEEKASRPQRMPARLAKTDAHA